MSEVVKLRTRAEIEEEAATWIWRMESAPSGTDPEGFEAWLRQDPRHRRAVEELSKVWETLDGLSDPRCNEPLPDLAEAPAASAVRSRRPVWFAAAAALVAAVTGTIWWAERSEMQVLATAVGQHRTVTLADGSVVSLNTNSIVETNIGRSAREIYLKKGEAHFEVAHDRLRPFLVHAGDAVVRAVGTEFEVRVRADRHVDVLVNEGRVEVQPDIAAVPATAAPEMSDLPVATVKVKAVSAGEELSTAVTNYAVTPISPEQLSSDLAWRDGAVVFDSEPLSQAISEIQRYTDARIAISDPAIAALPVGGRFKTDDLQGFLNGLEAALPVSIRRTSDGSVYIDPRH
jgi:transmembrane sensor